MLYTQSQIRDLLAISVESFRVWRAAVPALAKHKGHGATFTPGDVVAMAVLANMIRDFGIRVSLIGDRLDEFFAICRGQSWLSLEMCVAIISADAVRLVAVDDPRRLTLEQPTVVIPCAPIVGRLRAALIAAEPDQPQGYLQFPPTAVGTSARR